MCNYSLRTQNFFEKFNSSPHYIFQLILAASEAVKKIGYNHLMETLISDLKRLDKGVTVYYEIKKIEIRAAVAKFSQQWRFRPAQSKCKI